MCSKVNGANRYVLTSRYSILERDQEWGTLKHAYRWRTEIYLGPNGCGVFETTAQGLVTEEEAGTAHWEAVEKVRQETWHSVEHNQEDSQEGSLADDSENTNP